MTLTKKMWLWFAGFWAFVVLLFVVISLGFFGFMPSFEELENPQSNLASEIISSDGKLLGTYFIENRTNVSYSQLSPHLIHALIATEDLRFYNHSGVDVRGLARVLVKGVIGQQSGAGGGSTITQQLAKNLFPRQRQSKISVAFRKLKEWVIAVKLERNYTKEEIIAMYFNTVDFGNNSFGVKTAANAYFGTSQDSLAIEEAAILVGMLKAPSFYSPVRNPERATLRREVVLNQMRKAGYVAKEDYDSIRQLPLDMSKFRQQDHRAGLATYFREYLRAYLVEWCNTHTKPDGTKYNLYRDGLRIYTTIDSRMQRYAEEAVAEHMGKDLQPSFYSAQRGLRNPPFSNNITTEDVNRILTQAMRQSERYRQMKDAGASNTEIDEAFKTPVSMRVFTWNGLKDTLMSPWDSLLYYKWFLHCGMMSIEPQTGHVKAYVGGINYDYFQFDNVTGGRRQVGSTFKPFLYTMALSTGDFTPCSEVANVQWCVRQRGQEDWCPKNSSTAREGEMVTLKWALANSTNYVSAYLIDQVASPQSVINLVRKMGVESPMDAVPSIALGSCDLTVCEMVGAMSTYANKGIFVKPMFITTIEDRNGVVLQRFVPEQHEAMSERTAYLTTKLMQGVVDGGTGQRVRFRYGITSPIAGKTGTSQNHSDGWFMGLTPQLVTGVWVGGEVRSIHFQNISLGQGANMALPIWALFMKKVFDDASINLYQGDFERPRGITDDFDCDKISGKTGSHQFDDQF
ncbi:MAG: transglycosylase domain-containing protein [Bacteroidales bacterium]|jgi:penicillin-binding protein 1A|nr:transglycosylase domain-containing protein [Bacteroidales bacterium]